MTTNNPSRFDQTRRGPTLGIAFLVAMTGALTQTGVRAQSGAGDAVLETRTAMQQLVETRRIIAREKRSWAEGKQALTDQIEVMRRGIASLREKIGETTANISVSDATVTELTERRDALEATSVRLAAVVADLEGRTSSLLGRLPEPIRKRVEPLSQRIPEDADSTKLTVGDRFSNVVGILGEINRFNREISVGSEVRTLADGSSALVAVLYVGVSCGYYVTAKGDVAGYGTSSAEGWVWNPLNDADAPAAIQRAIAIYKTEVSADFVRLPFVLR